MMKKSVRRQRFAVCCPYINEFKVIYTLSTEPTLSVKEVLLRSGLTKVISLLSNASFRTLSVKTGQNQKVPKIRSVHSTYEVLCIY